MLKNFRHKRCQRVAGSASRAWDAITAQEAPVLDRIGSVCAPVLLAGILSIGSALADDASWRVSKSSGEVWMTTSGVQEASLTNEATLKPGDTIRTGRSGRVLLTRGEETMLVSPNSVIALPEHQKDGLSTTIIEQAGSILIQAEKRNVKHFQVETPYLAAVVKGTQFRVSVNAVGSTVEVIEGRVEVADFKSGQFALVLPGQAAKVAASGAGGLILGGPGKLSPIEKGTPRQSPFERVRVPKGGLAMPGDTGNGKSVHVLGAINVLKDRFASIDTGHAHNVLRINAPLGEVTLNFVKATDGIAHGAVVSAAERLSAKQAAVNSTDLSFGSAAVNANAQDTSNAGGNDNGLALGLGNGNVGGNGNGLALGLGLGNGNAGSNGNGLALGNGNGNAIGIAIAKAKAKGKL
jgi:FecR protein